ncbi:MAG: DUF1848 domain-containing protein [Flavonifractor plautii]
MILSVSRRTDIPRWYSEWLLRRLRAGEVLVRNPYRPGQLRRVPLSPAVVDAIVFWTKDPAPLLPWLDELDGMGYRYLFQFTLTPYGPEIEPGLRDKRAIVETFQVLGCRLGRGRVLWRYDPILFTDAIGLAWHEARFRKLCKALSPFTDQVTVSFLDPYPGRPWAACGPQMPWKCRSWRPCWGKLQRNITCQLWPAARRGLLPHGIGRAACIDRARLERLCGGPLRLGPDRGQRPGCGCCESVDIGAYDTCPSGCRYCYANRTPTAQRHGGRSTPPTAPTDRHT